MFTTLLSFALLATSALAFKVTVPDTAAQCGDLKIQWDSQNDGPYYVEILNPEKPCDDALVTLGDHDGASMTWYGVTLVTGTKIQVYVESEKDEGWSEPITVTDGLQDCLAKELWTSSATPAASSSKEEIPSSSAAASSSTALLATPSVVAPSNTKVSSAPSSSGSAPAIVGAAGAEPGQGDGALSVKASGSIMALSALVAAFALL